MKIKHSRLSRMAACGLSLLLAGTSLLSASAAGGEATLKAVDIKADDRQYSWAPGETATHTYDFTDTNILTYSRDEKLANVSLRTNMIFDGETLACKDGKTFSFGSAIFLGDDFGLRGGELSFDLKQTGGKLSVGLRLAKKAATADKRGLWFTFDGAGKMTVTAPGSELEAVIEGVSTDGRMTFRDKASVVEVLSGETVVATVRYDAYRGAISVAGADGREIGAVKSSEVQAAGYFTLYADSMKGTIDNLSFTHTEINRTDRVTDAPAIDYASWVAIDDLDRVTPTNETTGGIREGKQVGLFYFLCQTGSDSETPRDSTYLYNTLGLDGMKAYMSDKANADAYFWAEPYFGYYLSTDSWVQRKHAYMLEAAGVDFIFVDLSNGATYDQSLISLFDTWRAIREEGGSTPDICLMGAGSIGAVWNNVKGYIYSEEGMEKYGDLFYQYKGKPLLMADISGLDAETQAELRERFTIRHTWAWSINDSVWNWLQEYEVDEAGNVKMVNGKWGHDGNGVKEQLALCMGHHPTTSKGRSYVNSKVVYNNDYGFSMDSGAGLGFANSFRAIKELDPDMLLITGWNEWIAGLQIENVSDFAGSKRNPFYLVDQFNTEYSRDGEPMKLREGDGVGFGDNYYYQMASYIREFKGWNAAAGATGQVSIDITDKNAFAGVGPTFTDTANDTAWRSTEGYFAGYTYINSSGRNDLLTAKVSQDAEYLYFTVNTAEDVVIADDTDWMNLYLDIDGDRQNGWEGFDIVLNRARDGHYVSVESFRDGWAGGHIGQALYTVDGNTMTIRLAKAVIGVKRTATEILFKWADNATVDGHVMEFMDLGDTAPNDRYAFRYTCAAGDATATPATTYKLTAADGSSVDTRDESTPLPGYTAMPELPAESDSDEGSAAPDESDGLPVEETTAEDGGCASVLGTAVILPIITLGGVMVTGGRRKREK